MPGAPLQETPDKNLEDFFGQVANIKVSMPFWVPGRVHMPSRVCLMKGVTATHITTMMQLWRSSHAEQAT